jgi:hypothetical protein
MSDDSSALALESLRFVTHSVVVNGTPNSVHGDFDDRVCPKSRARVGVAQAGQKRDSAIGARETA